MDYVFSILYGRCGFCRIRNENYTKVREGLIDVEKKEATLSWLKLYIVVSGLLIAATYMAVLTPYVTIDDVTQSGSPLSGTLGLFSWIRALSAMSFFFSCACIIFSFCYWNLISQYTKTEFENRLPPSNDYQRAGRFVLYVKFLELATVFSLPPAFVCASGAMFLAIFIVLGDIAAWPCLVVYVVFMVFSILFYIDSFRDLLPVHQNGGQLPARDYIPNSRWNLYF